MTNIIFQKKFPNVITFTHNDMDGLFSAMIIKSKYDNNLMNNSWERNVQTYVCTYGQFYNLEWFKEKVLESYKPGQQNIVFMTDYAIQPNTDMLKFWNWLTDKECEFYWIDHHITAIENIKHLHIPGFQTSLNSGCKNTWLEIMRDDNIPMCIRFANDFDIWNKNSEYSWEKQLYPLCYYIESLGIDINDNQNELVQSMVKMLKDNNYTNQCLAIGKYIYKYVLNKYKINTKKIYSAMWNNMKCLLINSSFNGSSQFESYSDPENELGIKSMNDADILIAWTFNGKAYNYGLYTTNPKINCGKIAEKYLNGGGHQGAAGGQTITFIFNRA